MDNVRYTITSIIHFSNLVMKNSFFWEIKKVVQSQAYSCAKKSMKQFYRLMKLTQFSLPQVISELRCYGVGRPLQKKCLHGQSVREVNST